LKASQKVGRFSSACGGAAKRFRQPRPTEFFRAVAHDMIGRNASRNIPTANAGRGMRDPARLAAGCANRDCATHKSGLILAQARLTFPACAPQHKRSLAMSDVKPKRVPRETAAIEPSPVEMAGEAVTGEPVPTVVPEAASIPEPPAAIAAAMTEPVPPPAIAAAAAATDDSWMAVADAQSALARGFEEFAVEMTGLARTGMVAGTDAALALLGARTLAEAVEINAGLARRGVDAMIAGSVRLSDIGLKTMTEASKPLLTRIGAAQDGVFPA
jgi:hypothetical protein